MFACGLILFDYRIYEWIECYVLEEKMEISLSCAKCKKAMELKKHSENINESLKLIL